MNEDIMRQMGYGKEMDRVKDGHCPLCNKVIHPNKDFKDELSLKEFKQSGMCQECQDKAFKQMEEREDA